jgi:hypothetical protein
LYRVIASGLAMLLLLGINNFGLNSTLLFSCGAFLFSIGLRFMDAFTQLYFTKHAHAAPGYFTK